MRAKGVKTIGVKNIKKQEQAVPVNQPILICAHVYIYIYVWVYIYIYIYILKEAVSIPHSANNLRKSINQTILPLHLGK